jgi:chromosome segregation ATPase
LTEKLKEVQSQTKDIEGSQSSKDQLLNQLKQTNSKLEEIIAEKASIIQQLQNESSAKEAETRELRQKSHAVFVEHSTLKLTTTMLSEELNEERQKNQRIMDQLKDSNTTMTNLQEQVTKFAKICEESQNTLAQVQRQHEDEKQKFIQEIDQLKKLLAEDREAHSNIVKQLQQEKLNMELSTIESLKEQINELKKAYEMQAMFDEEFEDGDEEDDEKADDAVER